MIHSTPPPSITSPPPSFLQPTIQFDIPRSLIVKDKNGNYYVVAFIDGKYRILIPIKFAQEEKTK